MSSILTNTSSMIALQTLKGINQNLNKTQQEISTGKSISSAKDNSAIWAISKVMESDVAGFKAIGDSLALGESSVAVARNASETITDLLTDIKSKIVAAQEENVDRSKIQTDIGKLRDQITSVVDAAQFNGLNLLKGSDDVDILSSLDRGADGTVKARQITVERANLEQYVGTFGSTTGPDSLSVSNSGSLATEKSLEIAFASIAAADTAKISIGGKEITAAYVTGNDETVEALADAINEAVTDGDISGYTATAAGGVLTLKSTNADAAKVAASTVETSDPSADGTGTAAAAGSATEIEGISEKATFDSDVTLAEGHSFRITVAGANYETVANDSDTYETVSKKLAAAISADGEKLGVTASAVLDDATGDWSVKLTNQTDTSISTAVVDKSGGTSGGGLEDLAAIDVTTDAGSASALASIEGLIQTSIDAAASFGSAQSRIETQSDFISKLTDSLKGGIGTMVDADMEETSARLQALQVQQQLGIQSLSIANQAPQSIMSLFR